MKNFKKYGLAMAATALLLILSMGMMSCKLLEELGLLGMSQAEAEALANSLAMASTSGISSSMAASTIASMKRSSDPRKNATGMIYIPIEFTYACPYGGSIHVTGDLSGSISDSGTGILQIGLTETIHSCQCADDGELMNGDPYISVAGTFPWVNWQPGAQRMEMGGAFTYGSKSCSIQLTTNFNNYDVHVSGTVCGKSIDLTAY